MEEERRIPMTDFTHNHRAESEEEIRRIWQTGAKQCWKQTFKKGTRICKTGSGRDQGTIRINSAKKCSQVGGFWVTLDLKVVLVIPTGRVFKGPLGSLARHDEYLVSSFALEDETMFVKHHLHLE